jgi:hypothetical protein
MKKQKKKRQTRTDRGDGSCWDLHGDATHKATRERRLREASTRGTNTWSRYVKGEVRMHPRWTYVKVECKGSRDSEHALV